jgi:hypothetical protein
MANIKITELDAITTLASTDVVPVVDVSADTTHKITTTNLFRTLPDGTAAAPALAFSSDQANGVYLAGTDTVGISTGGTQRVTVDGSGNVTISGDLTVSGATTTVESTTVTIDDKNIELGSVASPSNTTADGGGITLKGATDKTIKWINSTGFWTFNTGVEIDGNLQMDDGKKIRLGTGQDLQFYHDGSHSYIEDAGTGELRILVSTIRVKNAANNEHLFGATQNGAVNLWYDGAKKLETKSDGIDVTGEVQCDSLDVDGAADITGNVTLHGNLDLQDNDILRLGTGDDLKLFHDGSNSYVSENGTGVLYIQGTQVVIRKADGTEDSAKFIENGAVELYHDNSKKFETKSDGIDVTGEVQCDTLDVDGAADITGNVTLHANLDLQDNDRINIGSSDDFTIRHNGTDTHLENDTGTLFISQYQDDEDIALRTDDGSGAITNYILCDGSEGNVRLYHYGTQKLATKSDGIDVTGEVQCDSLDVDGSADISSSLNVSGNATFHGNLDLHDNDLLRIGTGDDLQLYHNGTNSHIQNDTGGLYIDQRLNDGDVILRSDDGTGGLTNYIACDGSAGEVRLYHYGSEKLNTKSGGIDVTGAADISGNISLGGTDATINFGPAINRGIIFQDTSTGFLNITGRSGYGAIFNVGSTEAMRLDSSSRLLLGTTTEGDSTADNFTIADSGNCGMTIRSGTSDSGSIFFSDATSGSAEYDGYIQYQHDNRALRFGTAATERCRIDSSGRVGIGNNIMSSFTANASDNLVVGSGSGGEGITIYSATNNQGAITFADGTSGNAAYRGAVEYSHTNDRLAFRTAGTGNRMVIDSSGRLLLGTTTEGHTSADDLTVSNTGSHCGITIRASSAHSSSIFFSDGTSGDAEYRGQVQYIHSSDALFFNTAATERFRITSTGAWAIEGASNYGTSGQVLTSNGNDSPTWQDAGSVSVGGASAISMNDSVKINFGAGNDLQIYHDGGTSRIDNATGAIVIKNNANDQDIYLSSDNGSGGITTYVRCKGSTGEVKLHYYGSEKLTTKTDGVDITGEVQCDSLDVDGSGDISGTLTLHGNLDMQDNDKIRVGSGDDLDIYHNGSNSFIDNATGDLYIRGIGDDLFLRATDDIAIQPNGNDNGISVASGGAVTLYHASSSKFATKSDGIDVTGEVQCDSLDVDGTSDFTGEVRTHDHFRAHDANGGIYMGDTTGGFGDSCAMARAQIAGYHASGSAVGDLVIGAERQKSILFGATPNSTGGIAGRFKITSSGQLQSHSEGSTTLKPMQGCRAFCCFKGTGTVSIFSSFNVSSVTDRGTGVYEVNFTTAPIDANYGVTTGFQRNGAHDEFVNVGFDNTTARTKFEFFDSGSAADCQKLTVAVFR